VLCTGKVVKVSIGSLATAYWIDFRDCIT